MVSLLIMVMARPLRLCRNTMMMMSREHCACAEHEHDVGQNGLLAQSKYADDAQNYALAPEHDDVYDQNAEHAQKLDAYKDPRSASAET